MPKRTDLHKILVIGAGPIVIGQGCEFDYSGTQAVKALKEEGYEVILVNSNPATIMTDPGLADRTYIEPIEPETVAAIVRKERPDAILPTLGGQTGLNTALALEKMGVLKECGVELIGANAKVIEKAESRELFRAAMENIGIKVPRSEIARNMEDVRRIAAEMPFPLIIRPAFTLGGTGGGIAYNMADLEEVAGHGLSASPVSEVMIEQSVLGWKEFEMEVMRDKNDNCVIFCSIENVDAMGVHTGDSITVAPAQTLTDAEYQMMRDASFAIMREIGVETGGSNVQFGINPDNGEMVVIEMNPRVSRSSALASKATGFPIAKLAAKLAIGYTLDELRNDFTRETAASFEPAIDYCVVKIPRFTFEKFPGAKDELTTSMKSVGEAMSIGRTFKEALQKGLRSMEIGASGLGFNFRRELPPLAEIMAGLRKPHSRRVFTLRQALLAGVSVEEIHEASGIDPWFIRQMRDIVDMETRIRDFGLANDMTPLNPELPEILREAKEYGFSDRQLSEMWKRPETDIRRLHKEMGIVPTFYLVDTCAAEFEAYTPYYYSTYEKGDEVQTRDCRKVLILGGGVIGCEFACLFAALGTEVTVVEMLPQILPATDSECAGLLARRMESEGIRLLNGKPLSDIKCTARGVSGKVGDETLRAEYLLVSIGRRPVTAGLNLTAAGVKTSERGFIEVDENFLTSAPGIYAIGDAVGKIMLAHWASAAAEAAVSHICGKPVHFAGTLTPGCIFTSPEIGTVGLSEEQCKAQNIAYNVGKFPFAALGKAMAMGETEGFVKILADAATDQVLGVHIIGPHATDLIAEAVPAMLLECTARELGRAIHAHPTLGEAMMEAAHAVHGECAHLPTRKRR